MFGSRQTFGGMEPDPDALDDQYFAAVHYIREHFLDRDPRRLDRLAAWLRFCDTHDVDPSQVTLDLARAWLERCVRRNTRNRWSGPVSYQYATAVTMTALETFHGYHAEYPDPAGQRTQFAELKDLFREYRKRLNRRHVKTWIPDDDAIDEVLNYCPDLSEQYLTRSTKVHLLIGHHLSSGQLGALRTEDVASTSEQTSTLVVRSPTGGVRGCIYLECAHSAYPFGRLGSCLRCDIHALQDLARSAGRSRLLVSTGHSNHSSFARHLARGPVSGLSYIHSGHLEWEPPLSDDSHSRRAWTCVISLSQRLQSVLRANACIGAVAATGMRMAHLAQVRRQDVDVYDDRIVLRYQLGRTGHERVIARDARYAAYQHLRTWLDYLDDLDSTTDTTSVLNPHGSSASDLCLWLSTHLTRRCRSLGVPSFGWMNLRAAYQDRSGRSGRLNAAARSLHHVSIQPLLEGIHRDAFTAAHARRGQYRTRQRLPSGPISNDPTVATIEHGARALTETLGNYQRAWNAFAGWCASHGQDPYHANGNLVVSYLHYRYPALGHHHARTTVSALTYAIREHWNDSTIATLAGHRVVQHYLHAIKNDLGANRDRTPPAAILDIHVDRAMRNRKAHRQSGAASPAAVRARAGVVLIHALGLPLTARGLRQVALADITVDDTGVDVHLSGKTLHISRAADPLGYNAIRDADEQAKGALETQEQESDAPQTYHPDVAAVAQAALDRAQRDPVIRRSRRHELLQVLCTAATQQGRLDPLDVSSAEWTKATRDWLVARRYIVHVPRSGRLQLVPPVETQTGEALRRTLQEVRSHASQWWLPPRHQEVLLALTDLIERAQSMPATVSLEELAEHPAVRVEARYCAALLEELAPYVTKHPGHKRCGAYAVRVPDPRTVLATILHDVVDAHQDHDWVGDEASRAALRTLIQYCAAAGTRYLPGDGAQFAHITGLGEQWLTIRRQLVKGGWLQSVGSPSTWQLRAPGRPRRKTAAGQPWRLVQAALRSAGMNDGELRTPVERDWLLNNLTPGYTTWLRNNALVCVGHYRGRRAADLARLEIRDVDITADGYTLHLRQHKSNIEGRRGLALDIYHVRDADRCADRCPACALDAYLDALKRVGATEGPLFPSTRRSRVGARAGKRTLRRGAIVVILKDFFTDVPDLDLARVTARSLRRGRVTQNEQDQVPTIETAAFIGHATLDHVLRYDAHNDMLLLSSDTEELTHRASGKPIPPT